MTDCRSLRALVLWGLLACTAWLAGCAAPAGRTSVILLPQADASASAVVVQGKDQVQHLLSQPWQRATANSQGVQEVDQAAPASIRQSHPLLFDLLPPQVQLYTVYFEAGSVSLTAASRAQMERVLDDVLAREGGELVITGHADTVGGLASNDGLSRRRAQQVREMFIARRFPASRIEVVGRGKRELAVRTPDAVDEPRNRRVTIEVR